VIATLRYITRVNERADLRAKLYRDAVDLLHGKKVPEPAADAAPPPQPSAQARS
jgi:hypothetical protein